MGKINQMKPQTLVKTFLGLFLLAIILPRAGITGPVSAVEENGRINQELIFLPENGRYFQYRGLPRISIDYQGGFESNTPDPMEITRDHIKQAAAYGNSFYLGGCARGGRATFKDLYNSLYNNQVCWDKLRQVSQWAYEEDVVLIMSIATGYSWSFECVGNQYVPCPRPYTLCNTTPDCNEDCYCNSAYQGTDMVRAYCDSDCRANHPNQSLVPQLEEFWNLLNADLSNYGLPAGISRMDLHRKMIEKSVEATWDYPNVVYYELWEYGPRALNANEGCTNKSNCSEDEWPDDRGNIGTFHRWWVNYIKNRIRVQSLAAGQSAPTHLIGMTHAGEHPNVRLADFHLDEGTFGFQWRGSYVVNGSDGNIALVQTYGVPMVSMSVGNHWTSFGQIPWGREGWDFLTAKCTDPDGDCPRNPSPDQVRDLLPRGIHPAENYHRPPDETLDYFLQIRAYLENILTWQDEPGYRGGDEINSGKLPHYQASARPQLSSPSGYTLGRKKTGTRTFEFAVVYRDADGDAPALHQVGPLYQGSYRPQTEVWVDINGDGRYDPDPGGNERLVMNPVGGTDYRNGVTYKISGVMLDPDVFSLNYVFRFADAFWYPPLTGELTPSAYQSLFFIEAAPTLPVSDDLVCFEGSDTIINDRDILVWGERYGQNYLPADVYANGLINGEEFGYLIVNWGEKCLF